MRTAIPRIFLSLALVLGFAAIGPAGPATAATASVYLVTPKWWGWCPGSGNSVTRVNYVVAGVSQGGDSGDDVVYARVNLNVNNTVIMAVTCRFNTPQGSSAVIRPTRNGQTFFMGFPDGSWTSG